MTTAEMTKPKHRPVVTPDMHNFLDKVDASPLSNTRKDWYYKQINIIVNSPTEQSLLILKMIRFNNALKEEIKEHERIRVSRTLKGFLNRAKSSISIIL